MTVLLARSLSGAAGGLAVVACTAFVAPAQIAFDGEAALRYARAHVEFGPRVPGTDAARRAGDWIVEQMRIRADTVVVQSWTHRTRAGADVPMRNVLARFRPADATRVLYVVHWDTRPVADNDPDFSERGTPGDGANDGASGVGLLVAVADVLKAAPPSVGVDLLFVDGEDYGTFGPDVDVVIGATYFAAHLPSPDYRPLFGVVWDMIGDRDLRVLQERHSLNGAPEVVERVWAQAAALGYARHFVPTPGLQIMDDHVPLLAAGLRVIDVIDLDYPYHHTRDDTLDKLSSASLKVVGDVALALIRNARSGR